MTLENKVEQEKPDWKEWLPVWGIYQVYKDLKNGKPAAINKDLPYDEEPLSDSQMKKQDKREITFLVYHAFFTVTPFMYLLFQLAERP